MATFQRTLTFNREVTLITIESDKVWVYGVIREVSTGTVVQEFREDVTSLLSATRLQQIDAMRSDAQAWLDNQPISW